MTEENAEIILRRLEGFFFTLENFACKIIDTQFGFNIQLMFPAGDKLHFDVTHLSETKIDCFGTTDRRTGRQKEKILEHRPTSLDGRKRIELFP
jgi:hypothetical protein